MRFSNKFEEASYTERLAFKNLCNKFNLFKGDDVTVSITPYIGMDTYDVLIIQNKDGKLYRRYIIELKIRSLSGVNLHQAEMEGYILESKKLESLKRVKNLDPQNNKMLYICFTNNVTYMWNLDDLIENNDLIKSSKEMNKATVTSKQDKVSKKIYLLKPEQAMKKWDYKYDESQMKIHIDEIDKALKIVENEGKPEKYCLFKMLKGEYDK